MTLFEEIRNKIGAAEGSEAEEKLVEIVNDLIFNTDLDDETICTEAIKRFNERY